MLGYSWIDAIINLIVYGLILSVVIIALVILLPIIISVIQLFFVLIQVPYRIFLERRRYFMY